MPFGTVRQAPNAAPTSAKNHGFLHAEPPIPHGRMRGACAIVSSLPRAPEGRGERRASGTSPDNSDRYPARLLTGRGEQIANVFKGCE